MVEMQPDEMNLATRFRLLEGCVLDAMAEMATKLSRLLPDSSLFLLVDSPSGGRRLHGNPDLCQAFVDHRLLPNGAEMGDHLQQPLHHPESFDAVDVFSAPLVSPEVATELEERLRTAPRKRKSVSGVEESVDHPASSSSLFKIRRLSPVKSENSSKSDVILAENGIVDPEAKEAEDAAERDALALVLKEEPDAESVRQLLHGFLDSSTKASAIKESSDPTIFCKNSVMYKVLSSLIWDYSKECVKLLPLDEKSKPSFSAYAFDLLWKFFPAFEIYDGNTPSINTGGCFRSPRGFFKNMFWNRLKDQTTRRKR